MKTRLFSALLAVCMLLTGSAFAWTVETVDWSEVTVEVGNSSVSQPSDWAVSEVEAARYASLIPTLTGNPGYQDPITREQFAELAYTAVCLIRGRGPDVTQAISFTDCSNPKVIGASAFGIVNGMGDGSFAPKQTANREQIATMILRAIDAVEQGGLPFVERASDLASFRDAGEVSSWAADSMGILAHNGLMKGTSDDTLSPQDPCTVEQSILLIYRMYVAAQS